jgi:hypothetical protein
MKNYTHLELASLWISYNGQKINDKRLTVTMKLTFDQLFNMLKTRKVI